MCYNFFIIFCPIRLSFGQNYPLFHSFPSPSFHSPFYPCFQFLHSLPMAPSHAAPGLGSQDWHPDGPGHRDWAPRAGTRTALGASSFPFLSFPSHSLFSLLSFHSLPSLHFLPPVPSLPCARGRSRGTRVSTSPRAPGPVLGHQDWAPQDWYPSGPGPQDWAPGWSWAPRLFVR